MPSSIQIWNDLPIGVRSIKSYKALKSKIKKVSAKEVPKHYYYGNRRQNILHTKLRLGCSDLNFDKHHIGLVPDDLCTCDLNESETANHYLLECGRNLVSKVKMLDTITDLLTNRNKENLLNIRLLLCGSTDLNYNDNCAIFEAVQVFIMESKRFET